MSINSINNYTSAAAAYTAQTTKRADSSQTTTQKTNAAETTGVVYEKSSDSTANTNKTSKTNTALVNQLKADLEQRTQQMQSYVQQLMSQQGITIGTADDMWKFLAGGNYTVTAAAKEQAKQAISEDGYWGVNQTSDRIVEFAKALSGGDAEKADTMIKAFQKGYKEATKTWGSALPSISSQTYDAVMEKFDKWKNEAATETQA